MEVPVINNANSCISTVSNFYAGQHFLAGTISVKNDANNLYVTFNTIDGWVMGQTHLYVGSLSNLPVGNSGNPNIGRFPYKTAHVGNTTNFTYTIPRSSLGSQTCIVVAAHADRHRRHG